jgi:putative addiction module CopG family antidote
MRCWEQNGLDKGSVGGELKGMKVSLPTALEDFVGSQVKSGEFDDASEVVGEALRLLREARESKAIEEMRAAFTGVGSSGGNGEPIARDRALIGKLLQTHGSGCRDC